MLAPHLLPFLLHLHRHKNKRLLVTIAKVRSNFHEFYLAHRSSSLDRVTKQNRIYARTPLWQIVAIRFDTGNRWQNVDYQKSASFYHLPHRLLVAA